MAQEQRRASQREKDGAERLRKLEQEVKALKEQLKRGGKSILVPIATLDPEPYALTRELTALVLQDDDAYVASLVDANVNASGETVPGAVANLKDMMIRLFERLSKEPKGQLGERPARQLKVLRGLMRRKARHATHR